MQFNLTPLSIGLHVEEPLSRSALRVAQKDPAIHIEPHFFVFVEGGVSARGWRREASRHPLRAPFRKPLATPWPRSRRPR